MCAELGCRHGGLAHAMKFFHQGPRVGQRDVMFDLLDAVSSRGEASLQVRGKRA